MKKILFCLIFCSFAFVANAQILDSLYENGSLIKIHGVENSSSWYHLIKNYDNDNYWIGVNQGVPNTSPLFSFNFDNDFNVYNQIQNYSFRYKYNNKLYAVGKDFICYDLMRESSVNRNIFNYDLNEPNFLSYFGSTKSLLSQEKEFFVFYHTNVSWGEKLYMYALDTLGNVLRSDSLAEDLFVFNIEEQGDNILLLATHGFVSSIFFQMYYIDKQTLSIVDSNIFEDAYWPGYDMKAINDSLVLIENFTYQNIDLINTISKNRTALIENYLPQGYVRSSLDYGFIDTPLFDYQNLDSIYFCNTIKHSRNSPQDSLVKIHIINFSINGTLNYTYTFDFHSDMEAMKIIHGIKATDDGGVLVSVSSGNYNPIEQIFPATWTNYVIKFMPNGYSNITNIETGDKESIKVYPNPAKDYIYVDIEASNFKQSYIELFDMQGRLVKKEKLKSKLGNRIGVSNLNAGAYTYNVSLNGKTISGKVIIGK